MQIGEIGNYYGHLEVKEEGGIFYWGIENHDGFEWEQIPQYLYDALVKYESERVKPKPEPEKYLSLTRLNELLADCVSYEPLYNIKDDLINACEELPNQKEQ